MDSLTKGKLGEDRCRGYNILERKKEVSVVRRQRRGSKAVRQSALASAMRAAGGRRPVANGPLYVSARSCKTGRERYGITGGRAERNWALTKSGFRTWGGLAKGRTIEEVAPSESEPHWVTAKSRNRITFRKRGTTGSGAGAQHPQGRVRSYLCGASALCEGASSGEPNGGVDDGPSDELVGASEPTVRLVRVPPTLKAVAFRSDRTRHAPRLRGLSPQRISKDCTSILSGVAAETAILRDGAASVPRPGDGPRVV